MLTNLLPELQDLILSYLTLDDLRNLSSVCWDFRNALTQHLFTHIHIPRHLSAQLPVEIVEQQSLLARVLNSLNPLTWFRQNVGRVMTRVTGNGMMHLQRHPYLTPFNFRPFYFRPPSIKNIFSFLFFTAIEGFWKNFGPFNFRPPKKKLDIFGPFNFRPPPAEK